MLWKIQFKVPVELGRPFSFPKRKIRLHWTLSSQWYDIPGCKWFLLTLRILLSYSNLLSVVLDFLCKNILSFIAGSYGIHIFYDNIQPDTWQTFFISFPTIEPRVFVKKWKLQERTACFIFQVWSDSISPKVQKFKHSFCVIYSYIYIRIQRKSCICTVPLSYCSFPSLLFIFSFFRLVKWHILFPFWLFLLFQFNSPLKSFPAPFPLTPQFCTFSVFFPFV